jgi:putative membrane protein
MTTASTAKQLPFRYNRAAYVLTALFAIVWAVSAYRPVMVADWWLENLLVFLFIGLLIATYRKLAFSDLSYLLIFFYLCMHEWGAHHKYANVPLGEWMRHVFHTVRNDYDRVVHFAFGALLAYPQREVLLRKANVRGAWALSLPVLITLGFGAAYEILEAVVACIASPDAGDAFLGLQGDPWDTHKDMFMAFAGAVVAMAVLAVFARARMAKARPIAVEAVAYPRLKSVSQPRARM